MTNIKTKIILSAIIFLSIVGFVGNANAAGASLYISPATLTKTTGDVFTASVGFSASGNKVCAVEGKLVFNGLTCQGITVASDVMAQSSPTCSNPYFLIGIPNCTTSDKVLLTLSIKAGSTGTASVSFTGVDVIGEGSSVGSTSTSGSYIINALPVVQPQIQTPPAQQPKATPTPTQTNNGFVGYVNGKIQTFPTLLAAQQAGATQIQANYQYSPSETISTPATTQQDTNQNQPVAVSNNLTANSGAAALSGASLEWFNYASILLVIVVIIYGIYYIVMKRKKK